MPCYSTLAFIVKRLASASLFITLALILAGLTVPGALNVRPANAQGCGDFIDLNVAANNITSLRNTISTAANASTLNKIRVNVPSGTYTLGGTEINIPSTLCPLTIDGGANNAANVIINGGQLSRVFEIGSSAIVTLQNLTIQNGTVTGNSGGGGVDNNGTLTVSNSTLSGNSADFGGGANNNGMLTISNSTLSGNSANFGGGMDNSGTLIISNSTLSGNSANFGGGVDNGSTLTISNSTLSGNSAPNGFGGGIFNGGTLNLFSAIVSNNTANTNNDVGGSITNQSYTLIGDTNALLALANNGGPTQTIGLDTTKPDYASKIGGMGNCGGNTTVVPIAPPVTTDQRGSGYNRKLPCDIGAFEANPISNTSTPTDTFTPSNTATATSTNTATATATNTATATPSNTATATPTYTATVTPSNTATVTLSNTPTATATNTATAIPTNTATVTPSNTPTSTATVTPSSTSLPAKIDSIGIYRGGAFYLRLHNSTGIADITAAFNPAARPFPIVGDWTGAGFDSIGVYDQNSGVFSLRNTITPGSVDKQFVFGNPNDTPLSGRWLLSTTQVGVGVYRPSNGILYVKNALGVGLADHAMILGNPGDQGVAGDWTGRGYDGLGVFRPGNNAFYLVNQVADGIIFSDINFLFGSSTDVAITGDWIGQGHDGVGAFRPATGNIYLKNALTTGVSDNAFVYGAANDQPIAGHWQVIYPPVAPRNIPAAPVLIPKTAVPQPTTPGSSAPGGNQIGG